MNEILFRGKSKYTGEWVYGSLILAGSYCCILESEDDAHPLEYPYLDDDLGTIDGQATPVFHETVGQYTGLKDKNGMRIFEGDIVKTKYGRLCIVVWWSSPVYNGWDLETVRTVKNCCFTKCPESVDLYAPKNLEIIGNIHDNPELIKEGE